MPTHNPFDKASRYAARLDPAGFLGWALGLPAIAFKFVEWLDTRAQAQPEARERVHDLIAALTDERRGGVPWAVAVEFAVEPDADQFGRGLIYAGNIWLNVRPSPLPGDRFQVGLVVVNLTGMGRWAHNFDWPESGLRLMIQPKELNLATMDAAGTFDRIVGGELAACVLPWIPLMHGGDDGGIIQRWLKLAGAELDDRRRSDYGALALIFAEAADRRDMWQDALKGWNMIRSVQVEEWQAEDRVEAVLDFLRARFQPLPNDLTVTIQNTKDLGLLKRWTVLAGAAVDLAQFRRDAGI